MNFCEKLYSKIDENKDIYIVFIMANCEYSKKAVNYLKDNNLCYKSYIVKDLNNNINIMDQLIHCLKKREDYKFDHSHRTLPIIFYNKKFIGGCSDLLNLN